MGIDRTLILCTASFPYGYGETFLETEIPFLAQRFNTLFILPDHISSERLRKVPQNVIVINKAVSKVNYFQTARVLLSNRLIRKEFFVNILGLPARNKVLLKSLKWGIEKKQQLKEVLSRPDSLHAIIYSYWLNHAAIGACLIDDRSIKIARIHNWDIYEERQKYKYLPLRPFLYRKLTAVYSISEDGIAHIKKLNYHSDKVYLSRLGVEESGEYKDTSKPFSKMISISNIIPLKRIDLIGRAFVQIEGSGIDWEHYGSGPLEVELRKRFPVNIKGQRSHEEIMEILQSEYENAFLINVSEYEGIPVSMMEAMRFGIPCIGTDVGGVREIIIDGHNGYLLSSNPSIDEVVSTIQKLKQLTVAKRREMRKNAFQTWSIKYNAQVNFTEFSERIAEI